MKNKHITILILSYAIYALLVSVAFSKNGDKSDLLQIAHELRSFLVEYGDGNLPEKAVNLQSQFKHLLRDIFIKVLETNPSANPDELKQLYESALKFEGIEIEMPENGEDSNSKSSIYGYVLPITIDQIESHPRLLAVTISISVLCGHDTSLFLFEKQNEQYRYILSYESPTYQTIDKAHSWFQYKISPKDKNGKYFIIAAYVNPWCSSNWQGLYYAVLRPGRTPDKPKILFKGKDIIYIGVDEPVYRLNVTSIGFTIDFTGEADPEIIMKPHHIKHMICGNTVY